MSQKVSFFTQTKNGNLNVWKEQGEVCLGGISSYVENIVTSDRWQRLYNNRDFPVTVYCGWIEIGEVGPTTLQKFRVDKIETPRYKIHKENT